MSFFFRSVGSTRATPASSLPSSPSKTTFKHSNTSSNRFKYRLISTTILSETYDNTRLLTPQYTPLKGKEGIITEGRNNEYLSKLLCLGDVCRAAVAFQEGTGRRIADGWQGTLEFRFKFDSNVDNCLHIIDNDIIYICIHTDTRAGRVRLNSKFECDDRI
jgi:hypothetical protein